MVLFKYYIYSVVVLLRVLFSVVVLSIFSVVVLLLFFKWCFYIHSVMVLLLSSVVVLLHLFCCVVITFNLWWYYLIYSMVVLLPLFLSVAITFFYSGVTRESVAPLTTSPSRWTVLGDSGWAGTCVHVPVAGALSQASEDVMIQSK